MTQPCDRALTRLVRAQVGAVSIDARLDCDAFATTHSATSHYDRLSFVGLAWRPQGEPICCVSRHRPCPVDWRLHADRLRASPLAGDLQHR
tara:strand:- start:2695 stop:2967 length:273 start_codon:yes stop_codon:yes gene_type:complete